MVAKKIWLLSFFVLMNMQLKSTAIGEVAYGATSAFLDFATGGEIAELTAKLVQKAGEIAKLEDLVKTLEASQALLRAKEVQDAIIIAEQAALVTKLKWAIGIGVIGVAVVAGGAIIWYCHDKNQTEKKLKDFKIKSDFYDCLYRNKGKNVDADNIPAACQGLVKEFIAVRGQKKYDKIRDALRNGC